MTRKTTLLSLIPLLLACLNAQDMADLYWQGQFGSLLKQFPAERWPLLSDDHKSLIFEAHLLNGGIKSAATLVAQLFPPQKNMPLPLAAQMAMALAGAQFLPNNPLFQDSQTHPRCRYYRLLYLLQTRAFAKIEDQFDDLLKCLDRENPAQSYYLLNRMLPTLMPFTSQTKDLTNQLMKRVGKLNSPALEKNAAILCKFLNQFNGQVGFTLSGDAPQIRFPLYVDPTHTRPHIRIDIGNRAYNVLLDTGNATGWILHSMQLSQETKTKQGPRSMTRIGTGTNTLNSQYIMTQVLPINDQALKNLFGIFIPRPTQGFSDANLNPAMIRNRISTLDFIDQQLILQTPQAFSEYRAKMQNCGYETVLPWHGFQYILLSPNGSEMSGLVVVETGASGLTLHQQYAAQKDVVGYMRQRSEFNGQTATYQVTPFSFSMGDIKFADNQAEIWPLPDYFLSHGGMVPDIILGPKCFWGRISISLDPFTNQVHIFNPRVM